ncbi:hypothetical protein LL037_16565 [Clostridium estertheticum]|uniref:Uncharacterized protein n=1 Tax=Clostridium estertheticum TaxID=238834 RepID=A0AA47EKB0_9CLOT|nr:hypothetical protein [Clostridium estertheticum]WAG61799.1 hypothetical protein LL038_06015 [Clostridium estertheticum]WAG64080.1 hypothetical protein LL037_16565 [Clostridium estertheticum]
MKLLDDTRFEGFNVPVPSKTNKGTKKDEIYEVMSFQLRRLEKVLNENGAEVSSTTIQGEYLDSENIIKIVICEDTSERKFMGRGKSRKSVKVSSIVPRMPFTQKNVTKLASERLNNIFINFIAVIRDKKLMSEILEIEETEDDGKLFNAFNKQYGELWLATSEREKELLEHLKKRSLIVIEKYNEKENKA